MPRFLVGIAYRAADGTMREAGEVVQISATEAAQATRDGFGRIVDGAAAAAPPAAAPDPAAPTEAASAPASAAHPGQPKMSSPRAVWAAFLEGQGEDPAQLQDMTRGQLIARAQELSRAQGRASGG